MKDQTTNYNFPLIQGVPRSLLFFHKQLVPLQYHDAPNYALIKGAIAKEIKAKKVLDGT